ncbi:MAG: type II secretion system protein GspN [Silvanigrellales bacterium]|jgi:type II secretion system protein N|nr:type II secretion system protein GspN [Silvanigrellales bacterium]
MSTSNVNGHGNGKLPGSGEDEGFEPDLGGFDPNHRGSEAPLLNAETPLAAATSAGATVATGPTSALGLLKRPTLLDDRDTGSSWDENETRKSKRTNPVVRAFVFIGLGLASFFFFLYLTFPYGVIKEVVVSTISDTLRKSGIPVRVSIGSLRPYWFTGLQLKDVQVTNAADANANLKLGEATVRLNLLPLLIGRATVTARLTQAAGRLDAEIVMPLVGAIQGHQSPSLARVDFKAFALDPLINHALAVARGSKDPAMVLVLPLLAKTTAGGALSGSLVLDNPDTAHFGRAKGTVTLDVKNAFLHIDDSTLKMPKQNFSDARIGLKFENNAIVVNDTKFKAEDIGVGLDGKITLPELPGNSATAELDLALSMHGEIEKNLGFIIPNMMRCKPLANGELKAKLSGPVAQMRCD